jgi:hypothetical protein
LWAKLLSGRRWPECEKRAQGIASHRGRRGRGGAKLLPGTTLACVRETSARDSIAQRSQRSRRGDWGRWAKLFRGQRWPGCENRRAKGKHRTEVTEVTERGIGAEGETPTGDNAGGLGARIARKGIESHRGQRRDERRNFNGGIPPAWVRETSQSGTGFVGEISTGDTVGWGRESHKEKASKQKVH